MANFVWLASYPKSGNTWLRAFIYNAVFQPAEPAPLDEITRFFVSESNPEYFQPFLNKPVAEATLEELAALRPQVQNAILLRQANGSALTKTHNQLTVFDGTPLHDLSKTAAAIYVLRNPLDLVFSIADHFGLSIDESIDFLNDPNTGTVTDEQGVAGFLGAWSHHVESWTQAEHERFLVLRYEDLLDKPLPTFTKVAKHLGLDATKHAVQNAVRAASFKTLQNQESTGGFAERSVNSKKFFRAGQKNQWIGCLSDEQITRVVKANAGPMQRFGYVPPKYRNVV